MVEGKNEAVRLSEELLRVYQSSRAQWAQQAIEDDAFRNGAQWSREDAQALIARNQFPIVVNCIHPAVEQAKALLTTNKPRFAATGREDSDTKVARCFSELLTWIWDNSLGNAELKRAVDDYFVRGMGAFLIYADPMADDGKGEIFLKALDPLDIYIDPNSQDRFARDAAHILVVRRVTGEQFVRELPYLAGVLEEAQESSQQLHPLPSTVTSEDQQIGTIPDRYHKHYERIDRYSKIKLDHYRVFDPRNGTEQLLEQAEYEEFLKGPAVVQAAQGQPTQFFYKKEDVESALDMLRQTGGIYHYAVDPTQGQPTIVPGPEDDASIPGSTVAMQETTVEELVKTGALQIVHTLVDRIERTMSVGGKLLHQDVLPLDDYPIVPLMNRHNRNPFPMSDVRLVRHLQEYVNKVRSLIIAHASNSTNVKAIIPRGAVNKEQLEAEMQRAGAGIIEVDMELGQPVVMAPIPLPNELYKNEADARGDIERTFGIYALMQGDQSQAPATYKGTVALDEYGQRRIKSKKDDIEDFLNQVARLCVQMIQTTYTEFKIIRLLKPNGVPSETQINTPIYEDFTGALKGKENDVTIGKYDVVVVAGSMLPSNRWARFEYYMELYKAGLIDQIEVLKQTEVADIEGVLSRFGEMQSLRQQVESLTEELKKTQGDLQTAQRESVQDRKRVEVEKFKTKLKEVSNKASSTAAIYEARLADEVKNIRRSGQVGMEMAKMAMAEKALGDTDTGGSMMNAQDEEM